MRKKLFGLATKDIKRTVFSLGINNNMRHTFSKTKKCAGKESLVPFSKAL
jgi:hypothetical protein